MVENSLIMKKGGIRGEERVETRADMIDLLVLVLPA